MGSTFVRWTGDQADCADGVVTVIAAVTCTAEFALLDVERVSPDRVLDGESRNPSVSDDGRVVAFESTATNLTPDCAAPGRQIYVRDRVTQTTLCVSRSATQQGNGPSTLPSISGDGKTVAFQSSATNLVPGCTTNGEQVFVRHLETGITRCVSVGATGTPADAPSGASALSRDGQFVAFQSDASNLAAQCATGVRQIFVQDLVAQTTGCVSVTGAGPGNLTSGEPAISRNGDFVVFQSNATNFATSGCTSGLQIFGWERASGVITCLSRAPGGVPGNAASLTPAVSDDASLVAFESDATNLAHECATGVRQIFVYYRGPAVTQCVSRAPDGQPGNGASSDAALSGDGVVVAFTTTATNLFGGGASLSASSGVITQAGPLSQIIRQSSSVANAVGELLRTRREISGPDPMALPTGSEGSCSSSPRETNRVEAGRLPRRRD